MITIRQWSDLTAVGKNGVLPPGLLRYLQAEFLMLREHLGPEVAIGDFDLTQHGCLTILCRDDGGTPLQALLQRLPGPWPEFVDKVRLPEGAAFRVGWLVDNSCCPMAYAMEAWLHPTVAKWLREQAVSSESDETGYPEESPF